MIIYGIKNCDTVKKAVAWLTAHRIDFEFHDYKTRGIDAKSLQRWADQVGWETLLNKRGTSWRKLSEAEQSGITTPAAAFELMQAKPSVIKRPLIEREGKVLVVGFDAARYEVSFPTADASSELVDDHFMNLAVCTFYPDQVDPFGKGSCIQIDILLARSSSLGTNPGTRGT
jgi:arsenate reductase